MIKTKVSFPFVALPANYADERGAIQPLVEGSFSALQIITSKKDTVRANHYHKADTHHMYVVSGVMRYYYRPVGSTEAPAFVDVKAGEMVFTPSNEEHAVHFLEDSAFLNITTGERDQSTYEDDIVRIDLFSLN
jgi:quercetin dioxygenase-like cupin family protein